MKMPTDTATNHAVAQFESTLDNLIEAAKRTARKETILEVARSLRSQRFRQAADRVLLKWEKE
jgi:hypothetical protein